MATAEKHHWISPEAYLLGENDRAEAVRCEYVNGQVYAMVGASRAHNLITGNFFGLLHLKFQGSGCQVFQSDMKVRVETANDMRFYYPDIQVTCEAELESYFNTRPILIAEVLSANTERTDRTEKLAAYVSIESLREYVLLSQDSPHAEIHRRSNSWRPEHRVAGDSLLLESVDLEVTLDEIYRGVFD